MIIIIIISSSSSSSNNNNNNNNKMFLELHKDCRFFIHDFYSNGPDDINIPRLVLNQFRWLDCIFQSKVNHGKCFDVTKKGSAVQWLQCRTVRMLHLHVIALCSNPSLTAVTGSICLN